MFAGFILFGTMNINNQNSPSMHCLNIAAPSSDMRSGWCGAVLINIISLAPPPLMRTTVTSQMLVETPNYYGSQIILESQQRQFSLTDCSVKCI